MVKSLNATKTKPCDKNCFECPYPDCIYDGLDHEDYKAEKYLDTISGAKVCKTKDRSAYKKKWNQENKERIQAQAKKRYAENRESLLAYQRKYRQENKGRINARARDRQQKQKEDIHGNKCKNHRTGFN